MGRGAVALFGIGLLVGVGIACGHGFGSDAATVIASVKSPPGATPLRHARQLITVLANGWDDVDATLTRWERETDGSAWKRVGDPLPAVLGRSGLGWGRGLNAPQRGPEAEEGDGASPAGAFRLGPAFGFAPPNEVGRLRVRYYQEIQDSECVDDVRSHWYNRIVNRGMIGSPDWSSSESMIEAGEAYRWGVVIRQNDPPVPGGGSCIFLHAWSAPHDGTAGCTGIEQAKVLEVIRWLDDDRDPVLVQLPKEEYQRMKKAWDLP